MKYLKMIIKNLLHCNDYRALRLSLLKIAVKIKDNGLTINRSYILKDRIKFYLKTVLLLFAIRFKKRKAAGNGVYFIEHDFDKETTEARKEYINHFYKKESTFIYYKKDICVSSFGDFLKFIKLYFRFSFMAFLSLFDCSRIPLYQVFPIFGDILMLEMLDVKELFFFNQHSLSHYLVHLYLARRKDIQVFYNLGNSSLYDLKRYGYFNRASLVFASKIHMDEFSSYEKIGWIKQDECRSFVWGNEFAGAILKMEKELKYDLGYFSTGIWAVNDNLAQEHDLEVLKSGELLKTDHWKRVDAVLKVLVEIARKHKKTLKLYLHPYEKKLALEHGIYPPYWEYVDNELIFATDPAGETRSNFFEAKIGITYFSSIFYDRMNYDLPTYFYCSPELPATRFGVYLKSYAYLQFSDAESLKEKILNTR